MKDNGRDLETLVKAPRDDEASAVEHYRADVGMNFDAGFGDLLEDTAAADVERVIHEHRSAEE